ncbi:MAG: hypothetical protein IH621_16810 [Krumholzibacteria bacterium]|nr:hypothetical protein [Candidatus Krumholzibacteria bacterium]
MTRILAVLLSLAATAALGAPEVRTDVPDGPPPAAGVESLAWLAGGAWSGEAFGGVAQETWLPPAGGQMAGVFRLVTDKGPGFYEIIILLMVEDRLTMRLKHFDPRLHGWEEKDETVDFPLVGHAQDAEGRGTWFFDGLTIVREGEDAMALHLRTDQGGQESIVTFACRRSVGP